MTARRLAALLICAAALSGCITKTPVAVNAKPPATCAFATCGMDAASLAKVTADAVGTTPDKIGITQVEPQFAGAVLVWRAAVAGKPYACKEGRDPKDHVVHYVDCQPSTETGPLKAFP